MKFDPISNSKCAYIIAQLARVGKWAGKVNGVEVRIARIKSQSGSRIEYAIHLKSAWVHGKEATVRKAVLAVNETLHGRPSEPGPQHISSFHNQKLSHVLTVSEPWLPYKDAEL